VASSQRLKVEWWPLSFVLRGQLGRETVWVDIQKYIEEVASSMRKGCQLFPFRLLTCTYISDVIVSRTAKIA